MNLFFFNNQYLNFSNGCKFSAHSERYFISALFQNINLKTKLSYSLRVFHASRNLWFSLKSCHLSRSLLSIVGAFNSAVV